MPTTSYTRTDVREILIRAHVDGLKVTLPAQLDRGDYVAVDKVLQALGGRWNRASRAHVFPTSPALAIAAYLDGGQAPKPPRTAEGYVPTPPALATSLVRDDLAIGDRSVPVTVLEPSAGDGALVRAILAEQPAAQIVAVEPNPARASLISGAVEVHTATLEEYAPTAGGGFDYVVMNPPFAVPGAPTLWVEHVRICMDLLLPGGHLVAIVPAGFVFRQDKKITTLRDLVEEFGGWHHLPDDAFGGIRTVSIHLVRPESGEDWSTATAATRQVPVPAQRGPVEQMLLF